jgi:hypothetical protein
MTTSGISERAFIVIKGVYSSFSISSIANRGLLLLRNLMQPISFTALTNNVLRNLYRSVTGNFIIIQATSRLSIFNRFASNALSLNTISTRISGILRFISNNFGLTAITSRGFNISRIFSQGVSITGMVTRAWLLRIYVAQQLSTIWNVIANRLGAFSKVTSLFMTFSDSVGRSMSFSRVAYESLNLNLVVNRVLYIIRSVADFFNFFFGVFGLKPLICSLQTDSATCTINGCYWCSGTCQATTCPGGQPSQGGAGNGFIGIQPSKNITNVTQEAKILLDTTVHIETPEVNPGDKVYATITVMKAEGPKEVTDINLTYWIEDSNGNMVGKKQSVVGLETIRNDIYFLTLPIDSPTGTYSFEASAQYDNATAHSFDYFQVTNKQVKPSIVIKRVDVPFILLEENNTIKIVIENQENRNIDLNATLFLPYKFIPQNLTKSLSLRPLSQEVIEFSFYPQEAGSFSGFASIEYEGKKIVQDFDIEVYAPQKFINFFLKDYWWVFEIALVVIIIVIVYKTKGRLRRKEKSIYVFSRKDLLPK